VLANAQLFNASKLSLPRHVHIPSAMSWILSSLRVSVGMAAMGAVVAEYLDSSIGLGHIIARADGVMDATGVFSGIGNDRRCHFYLSSRKTSPSIANLQKPALNPICGTGNREPLNRHRSVAFTDGHPGEAGESSSFCQSPDLADDRENVRHSAASPAFLPDCDRLPRNFRLRPFFDLSETRVERETKKSLNLTLCEIFDTQSHRE
jgi:hypothetical protein